MRTKYYDIRNIWWIKPHKLIMLFIIPLYILLFITTRKGEINGIYNYFSEKYFYIGLAYLLLFAFFIFVGTKIKITQKTTVRKVEMSWKYMDLLALLSICAYLIWFGTLFLNPRLLLSVLAGDFGTNGARKIISTVPGITTLAQLGVVYVSYFFYSILILKLKPKKKRYLGYLVTIIFLTILRIILWTERLALIEIMIPIIIILIASGNYRRKIPRIVVFLGPYIGLAVLIIFFALTESLRSWNAYSQFYDNVFEFSVERVFNYYTTAINNGLGTISNFGWGTGDFSYLLHWLYKMPFIGEVITSNYDINNNVSLFLKLYGDPEFNNPSGLFIILYEMGIVGGILYFMLIGMFIGMIFRGFSAGSNIGILLYPTLYTMILEIFRIIYISEPRSFPIILFSIIGYLLFTRKRSTFTET